MTRRSERSRPVLAVLALLSALSGPAFAAPVVPAEFRSCGQISEDSARLACFDKALAGLSSAPAAAAAPVAAAPVAAAPVAAAPVAAAPVAAAAAPAGAGAAAAPLAGAAAVGAAAASAPAGLTPEQKLGLSPEGVRKLEEQHGINSPQVKGLSAHVTGISRNGSGRGVYTLDNGQVWQQSETRNFEISPGDEVSISSAAFGSFWLATDKHNWTRVQRVR